LRGRAWGHAQALSQKICGQVVQRAPLYHGLQLHFAHQFVG
jgi:hypothetical protein